MNQNPESPDLRIQLVRLQRENDYLNEIVKRVLRDLADMNDRITHLIQSDKHERV